MGEVEEWEKGVGRGAGQTRPRRGSGTGRGRVGRGSAEPQISVCFHFGSPGRGSGHVHTESGIWQLSVPYSGRDPAALTLKMNPLKHQERKIV